MVTDRRITSFAGGSVLSERSTKLTVFRCANAHGAITYNGIGLDASSQTPSEWLQELSARAPFGDLCLHEVVMRIRADTQSRIDRLPASFKDRRHTFVVAAWLRGQPRIYVISNYETASSDEQLLQARAELTISQAPHAPGRCLLLATGSHKKLKASEYQTLLQSAASNTPSLALKDRCVKMIKNISYRQGRKQSVGTSSHWIILGAQPEERWFGLDVPGGTTVMEYPYQINVGVFAETPGNMNMMIGAENMQIKDAFVQILAPGAPMPPSIFDPVRGVFALKEPPCPQCKTKIPLGYNRCPVCDHLIED